MLPAADDDFRYQLVQMQHNVQDARKLAVSFEEQYEERCKELEATLDAHSCRHRKQVSSRI